MCFSPLNFYTFAAARGQLLRPDVQALLKNASVGLYSDFANSHPVLCREAEVLRKRLDALLFGEPSRRVKTERPAPTTVARHRGALDDRLPTKSDAIASVAGSRQCDLGHTGRHRPAGRRVRDLRRRFESRNDQGRGAVEKREGHYLSSAAALQF